MLLGDEYFLAAHDDINGRVRLHDGAIGLGLAGSLLAELVLFGRLGVERGQVRITNNAPPPDPLAHIVLDQIRSEGAVRPIGDWLRFIGKDAYEHVGQRLTRIGQVRPRQSRRLFRTAVVFESVDMNVAAAPVARLSGRLVNEQPLSIPDATLGGMMAATGLQMYVLRDAPGHASTRLRQQIAALPPPLRELIAATETAVGDAVLSHRR